jgi:hypothetical protein
MAASGQLGRGMDYIRTRPDFDLGLAFNGQALSDRSSTHSCYMAEHRVHIHAMSSSAKYLKIHTVTGASCSVITEDEDADGLVVTMKQSICPNNRASDSVSGTTRHRASIQYNNGQ